MTQRLSWSQPRGLPVVLTTPLLAVSGALSRAGTLPVSMADRDEPPERGAFALFGTLTGIATLSAACVALGAGVGWWLDEVTSAPHVFVFLGLALGVAAAVLSTWSIVKRYFRE